MDFAAGQQWQGYGMLCCRDAVCAHCGVLQELVLASACSLPFSLEEKCGTSWVSVLGFCFRFYFFINMCAHACM